METFTDEEFKEFCEKLEKEMKTKDRMFNGEFEALDDVEDETLKNIYRNIIEILNEAEEQNDKSVVGDLDQKYSNMEQKLYNRIREILSIDRMTDEQFEKFLDNEYYFDTFKEFYTTNEHQEDFNNLSEKKKNIYEEKDNLRKIELCANGNRGFPLQDSWGNLSESSQIKYFQEIMELFENTNFKIDIWHYAKEKVQAEHFKDMINDFEDDFNSQLELWKTTHPEVQQENFENIMNKFEGEVNKKIRLLKETDSIALKENAEFIFDMIESIKTNIFEEKDRFSELTSLWNSIGAELQNSEKGKEYFDDIWNYLKNKHKDLISESSEEFIKQNFCGIINKLIEDDDYSYWPIFNLEEKVSDETLIEKDNFESLNKYYTKGKPFDEKKYEKIRELFKLNNNIVRTIDFDFLANEDILTNYTDEQLLRITNYPEIQNSLHLYCYKNGGNVALKESINYMLSNDNNWVISLDTILNNIEGKNCEKKQYDELIKNISQVDENDITDDFKQQLLSILSERENYFDIKNYEDVCNYTNIRNEVCEKIFNGNFEDIPETLKERYKGNRDNLYKFALLEHQFGISLQEANGLISTYGIDAKEFPNGEIKDYLLLLDEIINCKNIEEIIKEVNVKVHNGEIESWLESVDSRDVEGQVLNLFEDMYNNVLYNPQKEEKARTETYVDEHGTEHKVDVYELDRDFCMCCRVEGSFLSTKRNMEDYVDLYDVPSMEYHGNCMSFIRQDSISYAPYSNEGFLVGYSGIRKNQLQMMGSVDLGSKNTSFNNYNGESKGDIGGKWSKFRTPNQLINHTRQRYNEVVTERYITDENGNVIKSKPDFLISFGDEVPDRVKMMATRLGIPVVLIDREKIVQKEYSRIEVMKKLIAGEEIVEPEYQQYCEEYKNLSMPELIEQIIIKFENNRTGVQFDTKLRKKYFSTEQFQSIINVIDKSIDKISKSSLDFATECLEAFKDVCFKELSEQNSSNDVLENDELKEEYEVKREIFESIRNKKNYEKLFELEPKKQWKDAKSSQKVNTLLQQYLDQGIDANIVTSVVSESTKENQKENGYKNNTLHNQYGD